MVPVEKLLLKTQVSEKFLHSEVNLLIQHIIVQDQDEQMNNNNIDKGLLITVNNVYYMYTFIKIIIYYPPLLKSNYINRHNYIKFYEFNLFY